MIAAIATARETDLDITELCNELQRSPQKKYVNELGIIFIIDGCPAAESFLVTMLKSDDPRMRFISYCQLLRAEDRLSEKSRDALTSFVSLKKKSSPN